jgi:hypothetical protein
MATPPAGWRQRSTNANEYEAILDLGNFNKYEINVNVQTGQRQIYTIDAVFRTRELVGTINSNGTIVRQEAWNNIARLPNGQTRLKQIVDASRVAANRIVGSVGTEEQKTRLAEQKEFTRLKSGQPPPSERDPNVPDDGSNPGTPGTSGGGSTSLPTEVKFDKEKFGRGGDYGDLQYPKNVNANQDKIKITQFKYVTADVFGGVLDTTNVGSILGEGDLASRTFTERFGSVSLPMPNNITESNETGWGSNELSTLSAAAMGAAVKGADALTNLDGMGLINQLGDLGGGLRSSGAKDTITKLLTLRAGSAVVGKLGLNVDPKAYLARATGTVVNPNLELLFQGPKLRSFSYQIKMSPRNKEDAEAIRKIIKFFKKGMAPQRGQLGTNGFFLGAPNVFQIQFFSGTTELKSMGQLKMCALTNFTVDYTPDGSYAVIGDSSAGGSQPVSTNITLAFSELIPTYEDDYGADDHTGFGEGFDATKIESQDLGSGETSTPSAADSPTGRQPAGGASPPAAIPTRVFQPGGPTAVPGLDFDPNRFGQDLGFGVRGI